MNYCNDANCHGAWLMDVDEDPISDSSSTNNDLTKYGTPSFISSAKFEGGFTVASNESFSGSGYGFGSSGFSFVIWAKTTNNSAPGSSECLMSNNDSGGSLRAYDTRNSGIRFGFFNGSSWYELTNSTNIYTQNWVHVCGVYSGSNNYIYINGIEDGSGGATGDPEDESFFRVGALSAGVQSFNGSMDEGAVFTRGLSSTEINDIMDNGLKGSVTGWVCGGKLKFII